MEVRPTRGVDAVITHALQKLTELPAVGRAGIALSEGAGRRLLFTASDRSGPVVDWCHIDAYDDVPLTWTLRSRLPVSGALSELADRFPVFVANQAGTPTTALIATTLEHDGMLLGGVVAFVHDAVPLAPLNDAVTSIASTTAAELDALRRRSAGHSPQPDPDEPSFTIAAARDVPAARQHLRRLLTRHGVEEDTVDDAVICLSELLANAVMHAGASADVHVERSDRLLRVTVRDRGGLLGQGPQPVRGVEPTAVHGRGLQILDALSTRWGSASTATGAAVWYEIDLRGRVTTPSQGPPRARAPHRGRPSAQDRVSIPGQDRR